MEGLGGVELEEQTSSLHNSVTRGDCFFNITTVFCNRTRSSCFAHGYLAVGLLGGARGGGRFWRQSLTHL